jgi:5-methylcytosine-specific restriction endonuclease McrA
MPSSKNYVRDYKQEDKTAKARGERDAGPDGGDAKRHRARYAMQKLGMVKPGQDVDHKKPIVKGGSNDVKNLRAISPSKNRSFKRTKNAGMK